MLSLTYYNYQPQTFNIYDISDNDFVILISTYVMLLLVDLNQMLSEDLWT